LKPRCEGERFWGKEKKPRRISEVKGKSAKKNNTQRAQNTKRGPGGNICGTHAPKRRPNSQKRRDPVQFILGTKTQVSRERTKRKKRGQEKGILAERLGKKGLKNARQRLDTNTRRKGKTSE